MQIVRALILLRVLSFYKILFEVWIVNWTSSGFFQNTAYQFWRATQVSKMLCEQSDLCGNFLSLSALVTLWALFIKRFTIRWTISYFDWNDYELTSVSLLLHERIFIKSHWIEFSSETIVIITIGNFISLIFSLG